jgi:biuret amidohydrolase
MVTFAINPKKSAVVAIDLQNCNVEKSPMAAPLGLQVVNKLNLLVAHYRAAGSTIIWTRHAVRPDHSDVGILGRTVPPVAQGVIDDGAPSAALHPRVAVQPAISFWRSRILAVSKQLSSKRSCALVGLTPF